MLTLFFQWIIIFLIWSAADRSRPVRKTVENYGGRDMVRSMTGMMRGYFAANTRHAIRKPARNISPPIVGVPAFSR